MKVRLTLIAAALALSGTAFAAGETDQDQVGSDIEGSGTEGSEETVDVGQPRSDLMSAIDKDGDGKVSQEELTSHFQQYDADGDGSLDQSEFAAFEDVSAGGTQMQQDQPVSPGTSDQMQQAPSDTGTTPGTIE